MTKSSSRIALAVVLALSAPVLSLSVQAAPSAADNQTARDLLKEGRKLREAKDFKGALAKFKAAHALVQTAHTGHELAVAHLDVGELVEARETAVSVVQMPKSVGETEVSENARAVCAQLAADLAPRIPSLTIKINGPEAASAKVTLDGIPIPAAAIGSARKVNPGKRTIVAISSGEEKKMDVELKEGEAREVTLELASAPPAATAPPAASTSLPMTSAPIADSPRGGLGTLGWIGVGIGAAGLVVGGVTGALAFSKLGAAKDKGCSGGTCPRDAQSDLDASKSMGTVSTIGFVAAACGGALLIVDLATRPSVTDGRDKTREPTGARASLRVGAFGIDLVGKF